jgi:hypothetical protein
MTDALEQNLRETFSERAARIDPAASARLRSVDYRPRRRGRPTLAAAGALGASATTAAVLAVVMLGSNATPAFAGWSPRPTSPVAGQLAAADQACSASLGTPVLTDTRGPYTASIYADATSSHTCLQGGALSIAASNKQPEQGNVLAGQVQLAGSGMQDSSGHALTLVEGRVGTGVTSVTIDRSDGSSIQATVAGGWYLAWWPGTTPATTAAVTSATGTTTESFPSTPRGQIVPACPAGSRCSSGYSFGSGGAAGSTNQGKSTVHGDRSQ